METTSKQNTLIDLPEHARLWVYQSDRPFTKEEMVALEISLKNFIQSWAAHGNQLNAAFEILYDRFIILAVDERQAMASGCSIDSSVGLIRQIETQYQVNLLDKSQVAYLNNDTLEIIPFNKAKGAIGEGKIKKDTIIFNNAVASVGEWKNSWKRPAVDSWMSRFFL